MINLLKNKMFVFFVTIGAVGFCLSENSQAETIVCKEVDSKASYKLEFNWKNETVEISSRFDNKAYKKIFTNATAVRNNVNDKRFLAEGTLKNYVGEGKDCTLIDTLYFDISTGGGKAGTLQKSATLFSKSGSCKAKMSAPDLSANTVEVTCSK
jgi:hypothetical protein